MGEDRTRPRVLVVEREEVLRQLLARIARKLGADCEAAETFGDLHARLDGGRYDAIVVDVDARDALGNAWLVEMLTEGRRPFRPRTVITTADFLSEPGIAFFEKRGFAVLQKPFLLAEIEKQLRTALDGKG
jgi:DNA-binding response OmpR family regulator